MTATLLNETDFQRQIVSLARRTFGYRVRHIGNVKLGAKYSTGAAEGFLDLYLTRPPRAFWAEVKGPATPDRHSQLDFIEEEIACRREVYLWRSGETDLQQIANVLLPKVRPFLADFWLDQLAAKVPTLRGKAR